MTSERMLKANMGKIKKAISETIKKIKESEKTRDDLFGEVLSQLNQEHEKLVGIVQLCKYELIFDELISTAIKDEEDMEEDDELI